MKYDLVLFDVDGVFLSEERCFDTSALVIWELLHAPHFLGIKGEIRTDLLEEEMNQIRKEVFLDNRVLDWMKDRGINANWDIVYLVFAVQLFLLLREVEKVEKEKITYWLKERIDEDVLRELGYLVRKHAISFEPDYDAFFHFFDEKKGKLNREELLVYFNQTSKQWFDVETEQFSRNSELWKIGQSVYQEWYLGEKLYQQVEQAMPRILGKKGYLYQEIALAEPAKMKEVLGALHAEGIQLGIGTGRPSVETEVPLTELGVYHYFETDRIVNATDVVQAEEKYPQYAPLSKPDPFTYIKGYLTRGSSVEDCLNLSLPLAPEQGKRVLIVGDSVADYLAARKMGCDFAVTLTGLTGQAARRKFEELQVDYILNDVTEILQIFNID